MNNKGLLMSAKNESFKGGRINYFLVMIFLKECKLRRFAFRPGTLIEVNKINVNLNLIQVYRHDKMPGKALMPGSEYTISA